tara:strand:+ start:13215 stop:14624 length:1410 start_codon:yes stop_codon:yes gene_type:complete
MNLSIYNFVIKPLFHLFDLFCILFAFIISILVRFPNLDIYNPSKVTNYFVYKDILFFSLISWLLIAIILNMQHIPHRKSNNQLWKYFFYPQIYFGFLISLFVIFSNFDAISRLFVIYFLIIQFFLLLIFRIIRIFLVRKLRATGYNSITLYAITDSSIQDYLKKWFNKNPWSGINISGYDLNNFSIEDDSCNSNYIDFLKKSKLGDYLILDYGLLNDKDLEEILIEAENRGLQIFQLMESNIDFNHRMSEKITNFGSLYLLQYRKEPLKQAYNQINKRLFDFIFSSIFLLTIFWWSYIIIGLIIKFTSKGPVFFIQNRIGKDGLSFYCIKFRTMHIKKSDSIDDVTTKNDKRVYPFGKFLRQTNLDEFPQFINVLLGSMSVVGPRPHMILEDKMLAKELSKYRLRHWVRPGITGLAAINGYRGGTEDMELMQKRINYDIKYIETWSLMNDIKICFLTIVNMLFGKNRGH